MSRPDVVVHFTGIKPEDIAGALARSVQTKQAVESVAAEIAAASSSLAQSEIGQSEKDGQHYASSFGSSSVNPAEVFKRFGSGAYAAFGEALGVEKGKTAPIFGIAFNSKHTAHILEWGSKRTRPRLIMTRAAESLGLPTEVRHGEGKPE